MDQHAMEPTPLIGNVYVLNPRVAQTFHSGKIPGVVVSDELLALCLKQKSSPDEGKSFFYEMAAQQIAIYRGLGYRGAYLGGVYSFDAIERIMAIEKDFGPNDWKQFSRELRFSRPGEFFFYAEDPVTGLANPKARNPSMAADARHVGFRYRFSKWSHQTMFMPTAALAKAGARLCANARDPFQGPALMRAVEHVSKSLLFHCKDCGDCSLPEIGYLCPESQCAKNQRNGPCGGTREGRCEVDGYGDCIWLRAYERLKSDGKQHELLSHAPVIQNQALRGTSAWANNWLGRDHTAPSNKKEFPSAQPPALEPKPQAVS
jgi:methylenetetrahydrofolate reductase (NADPH)